MTPEQNTQLSEDIRLIESMLNLGCEETEENCKQKKVLSAMRYSLDAGGKRLRPVLVLEFCRACGGTVEDALRTAVALEQLHTFSLIHDDLPAMDNDDFRRGKPSCHKAFDEATAILAGDALAVQPFGLISGDLRLSAETRCRLVSMYVQAVGAEGMIGGQIMDMEYETRSDVTTDMLLGMYRCKTGALIRTACAAGCVIAGADEKTVQTAEDFADRLGLAFQIVDDILDVISTQEMLGKPIGSDAEQNKTTFVTLLGLDGAKAEAERLTDEALALLAQIPNSEFLRALTESMLIRMN